MNLPMFRRGTQPYEPKHLATDVMSDTPSRNPRARLFQASTNGQDFYNATHKKPENEREPE